MEGILKDLKSPDVEIRLKAVEGIGKSRERKYIPYLLEAIGDAEWRIRKEAVSALLTYELDEGLIQGLIRSLRSEDNAGKRNAAVEVLVKMGEPAVPWLLPALGTADPDVRKFLVDILGEIGHKGASRALLSRLSDPNDNVVLASIEALGKIGDRRIVPALCKLLTREDPLLVFSTIKALEKIGDPRAADALVSLRGRRGLEKAVMETLGSLGDPRALDTIIETLQGGATKTVVVNMRILHDLYERNPFHHESLIIQRVREIYGEEVSGRLLSTLDGNDEKVKKMTIKILGWMSDLSGVKKLVEHLEGKFKEDAFDALVQMGSDAVPPLIAELSTSNEIHRQEVALVLGEIQDLRAVPPLTGLLTDSNGHVRQAATRALGRIGAHSASRALIGLLSDPYPDVQEAAVEALGRVNDATTVPRLLELLSHEKAAVRAYAAKVLGMMKAREAIPLLSFALKDPDPFVRRSAIEALRNQGEGVVEALLLGLADEEASVRLTALSALIVRQDVDLLPHLTSLVTDDSMWVRAMVARAAGELFREGKGRDGWKALLLHLLRDPVGVVQIAALEALGRVKDPHTTPLLSECASSTDQDVRKAAVTALGDLRDERAVEVLTKALSDAHWGVRAAAAMSLRSTMTDTVRARLQDLAQKDPDAFVRKAASFSLDQVGG